ncbi:ABC transporter substrate-binding protein [Methanospirillum sp. J.3.6.1-F.2.7.3]|jgi:iron complex transport system substrate-binding protein|uniref:ABC transporter substrate-binding protein n=1 Tax=Methanospirillum purgamenti TaxID=2834276 RepID=A0A8E7AXC6_9EURY|nr:MULTISPECIES: ABC transporter substrate-binding protein [Methanospirillum]MDX8548811.1 ABC transporter substrate-binding protein [Methanospirillum hungatei]QVV88510.1 ABC transporter substrate-binding protein [Methanospirillum sp. J.3.6.1-F.2.7.3]
MKNNVFLAFVVLIITIACIFPMSADTQASERAISDALGRELTIPAEITGVVSTAPPTTMTLYLIAPDLMLGWNSELTPLQKKYIPKQYQSIPVVGGWFGKTDGNFETFIKLNPDIILEGRTITGDPVDVNAVEDRQSQFGDIPLITVQDTANISGYAKSISFIGDVLNKKEKSDALVAYYQTALKTVKDIVSTIPEGEKIKVYYAEGPDGLATDPSGSQHAMLIDYCGGKNVAETTITPGYGMTPVSLEQVLSWNPEVIIASDSKFASSVLTDPLWKDVPAVQSGRVYGVPVSPFSWFDRPPGTNQIPGLYWMLHTLYPEKFSTEQLKEKITEFYSSFYGVEVSATELDGLLSDVPVYE